MGDTGLSAHRLSWAKGATLLVLFALAGLAFAAGGLATAPIATLGALCALGIAAVDPPLRRSFAPGPAAWAGAALLGWAALTLLWTPYDQPGNLARGAAGVASYLAFVLLALGVDGAGRRLARAGVLLSVVSAGVFFAFELVTQGAITASYRADSLDQNQVWRNLGHGLSAWLVVLPAALLTLRWRDPAAAALGVALLAVAAACALGFGLSSNVAGLLAGAAGAAAAWRWPRASIATVGVVAAALMLLAPALALLARATPADLRAAMPDSWELRLEAWTYALGRIAERPMFGWGFDASRTMTDTIQFNGETVQALPLHPHNAGLHIWLETGLVGAGLAAALMLLLARRVARAPGLTRVQATAATAAAAAYVAMAQMSYGVWQEWWVAAVAWAAAATALTGPAAGERSGASRP
jgi:O-antigen ligase